MARSPSMMGGLQEPASVGVAMARAEAERNREVDLLKAALEQAQRGGKQRAEELSAVRLDQH